MSHRIVAGIYPLMAPQSSIVPPTWRPLCSSARYVQAGLVTRNRIWREPSPGRTPETCTEAQIVDLLCEARVPTHSTVLVSKERMSPDQASSCAIELPALKSVDGKTNLAREHLSSGTPAVKQDTSFRKAGGWKTAPFIFVAEFFEILASGGILANMISYLTQVMHFSTVHAANIVTNFSGTSGLTPVIGAFLADSYLGRYMTIAISACVHLLGITLLALATGFRSLVPPQCPHNNQGTVPQSTVCRQPSSAGQTAFLYLSLGPMALGTGGIRACVSPFGAEQFDLSDPRHEKQMGGFFNWFYFSLSMASLLAVTVVVYIQENVGWGWGFGLPALAISLGIVIFLSGSPFYRKTKPSGSPMTRVLGVMVAATRKRSLPLPPDPNLLFHSPLHRDKDEFGFVKLQLPHTDQFRFLDKAAIVEPGVHASQWRLCPVNHVEEVKCLLRMLPIWLSTIMTHTTGVQQRTFTVQQARVMDRRISHNSRFQIPPGSFGAFSLVVMLAFIPFYERLLLPAVRKLRKGRGVPPLQRVGIGLVISILSMVVAGIVETRRRQAHQKASAYWLVPQYALSGLAEAFIIIGDLEFSYSQSPESMRSIATALHWSTIAAGNFLSSVLVSIVNSCTNWLNDDLDKARLAYFYWLLATLNAANVVFYLPFARWYKYVNMDSTLMMAAVGHDHNLKSQMTMNNED